MYAQVLNACVWVSRVGESIGMCEGFESAHMVEGFESAHMVEGVLRVNAIVLSVSNYQ